MQYQDALWYNGSAMSPMLPARHPPYRTVSRIDHAPDGPERYTPDRS